MLGKLFYSAKNCKNAIFTPKRANLDSKNFENQLLLKLDAKYFLKKYDFFCE